MAGRDSQRADKVLRKVLTEPQRYGRRPGGGEREPGDRERER